MVLTAIIAIAFGFLLPDAGILREADGTMRSVDKAVFPSLGLLQGMFTSENNLGQYLAYGVAAVAMLPRWWLRLPGSGDRRVYDLLDLQSQFDIRAGVHACGGDRGLHSF